MLNTPTTQTDQPQAENGRPSPPAISLPKGGGAIRGMGEKFAANPATGTGSLTVPIFSSPGRSGFGPQLSLSYDSGSGNGPFGFGWSLSLPSITRKTDKGFPQYRDAEESDEFILSGAEDLVPVLVQGEQESWGPGIIPPRTVDGKTYTIQRYRPRIEGLFARIERWTNQADPQDTFWRSISRDNITTWYGRTEESRIADPTDETRIFSWLICESHDDKGNVIVYTYKEEDSTKVGLSQAHERNRTDQSRSTNRYLKRIRYGNHTPYFPQLLETEPWPTPPGDSQWFFEVVFDYGEHAPDVLTPNDTGAWDCRHDPFSSYRAGFEVRTYRLCQRVLIFHHFPNEQAVGQDCLVRSTDLTYAYEQTPADPRNPIHSVLMSVTQSGYTRQADQSYLKKSLPPLEFAYSQAMIHDHVHAVDAASVENLPTGLDNTQYQWVDLDGEGVSGVLAEQAEGWFYKENLSPINIRHENGIDRVEPQFGPIELIAEKPSLAAINGSGQQLLDLAGDGQLDVVALAGPTPGFYERTHDERWESFRPFASLPNLDWDDPNLKFVDLTGDGHADILISEDEVLCWHASLAEAGFGPAERVRNALDEEKGPHVVFADGTQSISLADISGDGLTDIVRIRNGEVCYWPNLGYGRFGAKVTMDDAPWFDHPDQFDHKRIRLADIDGSGVTDILYLSRDGVQLYFNQSGNSWSAATNLTDVPPTDNVKQVTVVDLLGNGTACLVWSSPLPGDVRQPMHYLDLMGGRKPHLLEKVVNNLGAETQVHYAPSTKFYLADKREGKPWITKIPFPVHVVERVETYDWISRNHFVTRYAYHHGYFDGIEREFRGFGMVEQWDTEAFAALTASEELPVGDNVDQASHVPPVHTKTWFHTGVYVGRDHISNFFAGLIDEHDRGEYYREPAWRDDDIAAKKRLLADTVLPDALTSEEEREACRALKGSMLRQEIYALDGTDKEGHPYTVTEQNFTIQRLQPHDGNRHAVFFTHARESLGYHYERNPDDPRVSHALTLEVNDYGNVLKALAIGYGRRNPATDPAFTGADKDKQTRLLITYTENSLTNPIDDTIEYPDHYRTPLPAETRTYELTGFKLDKDADRFRLDDWTSNGFAWLNSAAEIGYEQTASHATVQKRLIEDVRIRYRKDDLTDLLPFGQLEPLALPGEGYQLAFTPGLATQIYVDSGKLTAAELSNVLTGEGKYVHSEGDANWWIPSGQVFYSPDKTDTAAQELTYATQHFFLPFRLRDPFRQTTTVTYDAYDLLVRETRDPVDNLVTAGERDPVGNLVKSGNNYRVLQPALMMDPNRNRSAVAFDALGMVVATAVMGKEGENLGDLLEDFDVDPPLAALQAFITNPQAQATSLLGKATSRIVYDLERYQRVGQPPFAATLARETHFHDPLPTGGLKIQVSFSYSDGFGREIQQKIQAEPGPVPRRDATGTIIVGADGQPEMTASDFSPRWVGSGWTVFNNKGNPVREYEPFFTDMHRFEFDVRIGVSPVLFYDPMERVVATLHPNHTYEKVVFEPWRQMSYDSNDTVAAHASQTGDPRPDPDIAGYVQAYFRTQTATWQTWYQQRIGGAMGKHERLAAQKAAKHANTPTIGYFDAMGRPFLTQAHNGFAQNGSPILYSTRVEMDIEGNERAIIDAKGRTVMRYTYSMAGPEDDEDDENQHLPSNLLHQTSMEAGQRWMLSDVTGALIRAWDSRGHSFRTEYDPLRRPLRISVAGADSSNPTQELLTERMVYGEQHPEAEKRNLRGTLFLQLDQAGAESTEANDFKGNPLQSTRRIATEYKQAITWSTVDALLPSDATIPFVPAILKMALAPLLETEAETYTSRSTYDALDRPVTLTTPHTPTMQANVIRPGYNEANLLERVEANLRGATSNGQPVWTPFVTNIDYDAKGQRRRVDYGNGVTTFYEYDLLTFHLTGLRTRRNATAFPNDCPQPAPTGWPGCQVQNLYYTYDPVGNIIHIRDQAQQTIYFRNRRVEPGASYTYDALYRLIEATGREHLGQVGGTPIPHTHNDNKRVGLASGTSAGHFSHNDGNAMGTYIESYVYDAVGNFKTMQHRGTDPANPGWKRAYTYHESSLIEPSKQNNRLSHTTVSNGNSTPERYIYDTHGNMTRMPHMGGTHPSPNMHWDYQDQLVQTGLGGGGTAYYTYDAGGERVRKVWEKSANLIEEHLYLGGFEIYRRRSGTGAIKLERETLHIMDDEQRIALVETRTIDTVGNDPPPQQRVRYQFSNHLGSSSLELDHQAQIISYEEYTPYGSTSYQAVTKSVEVAKRYRFSGKQRDTETGLYYFGARYYAPWLARWCTPDPAGLSDAHNLYIYAQLNPIGMVDPLGVDSKDVKELRAEIRRTSRTIISFPEKHRQALEVRNARAARLDRAEDKLQALDPGDKSFDTKRKQLEMSVDKAKRRLHESEKAIEQLNKTLREAQESLKKLPKKVQKLGLSHEVTAMISRIDRAQHKDDLRAFDKQLQDSISDRSSQKGWRKRLSKVGKRGALSSPQQLAWVPRYLSTRQRHLLHRIFKKLVRKRLQELFMVFSGPAEKVIPKPCQVGSFINEAQV